MIQMDGLNPRMRAELLDLLKDNLKVKVTSCNDSIDVEIRWCNLDFGEGELICCSRTYIDKLNYIRGPNG
jgi:hypothetical protein